MTSKEGDARYRARHPERIKQRNARYYAGHKEKVKAANRKWAVDHPEADRAKKRAWQQRQRLAALGAYGGKCACCGETTTDFLCIDHINDDGGAHRRQIGRGNIFHWLQKNEYPDGFQVLCWNCNAAKAMRGGCPHKKDAPK